MPKITALDPPPLPLTGEELVPVVQGEAMWVTTLGDLVEAVAQPFVDEASGAADLSQEAAAGAVASIAGVPRQSQSLRRNNVRLAGVAGKVAYNTSSNFTSVARGYLAGTDFASASFIDGVRYAGNGTDTGVLFYRAFVFERAPDAANLNAAPGAVGDVLVTSGACTRTQYQLARSCVPVDRYQSRAGFYYFAVLETYAADDVTRAAMARNGRKALSKSGLPVGPTTPAPAISASAWSQRQLPKVWPRALIRSPHRTCMNRPRAIARW